MTELPPSTFVGEFHARRKGSYVVPLGDRTAPRYEVPEGMERPAAARQDRIGAAAGGPRTAEEMDGLIVDAAVLRHPVGRHNGAARVLEILGHPDDFGIDVEIVIRKHRLPHHSLPAAQAQWSP